MSISASDIPVWPRRAPIASCLAVALGVCAITASGRDGRGGALPPGRVGAPATSFAMPSYSAAEMPALASRDSLAGGSDRPASTLQVMNCDDSGPGSLRDAIAAAASGATIDLSQLACSTITLGSRIDILQNDLRLLGPGSDQLSIDGDAHTRNFLHTGAGTLRLDRLTVTNGYYAANAFGAAGGCIDSFGSVVLEDSIVSNCVLYGTDSLARGGAILAEGDLTMTRSAITGNLVTTLNGKALGGAAYVIGDFYAKYSTIADNAAYTPTYGPGILSEAGGIFDWDGDVSIWFSTISGNRSFFYAGLFVGAPHNHSALIVSSTISSNVAQFGGAGIVTKAPLSIVNSTIAFNTSINSFNGAGLRADDAPVTLNSSIVAGNGGPQGDSDVAGSGIASITGSNNLIVSSNLTLPAGTLQACPKLEPLAENGGNTLTHALKHDSPAIDNGSNTANLVDDQRLAPRVAGPQADIGAVEWQPGETDDRLFVSSFDGRCDG